MTKSTIDQEEISKFNNIANEWWDYSGKFKPLHKMNPSRILYIKEHVQKIFNLESDLQKIDLLDVGCGGGLIAEPMSRLGSNVVAIDAGEKNIKAAKIHAQQENLKIDYRQQTIEDICQEKKKFDVVLALEIVEHVANVEEFISSLQKSLKPNGVVFISTINRNYQSFVKAIVGAEYVLRWLPIGTHSWKKFLKPAEIYQIGNKFNLETTRSDGFEYNIFKDEWRVGKNLNVNYMMILRNTSNVNNK
jgi:2-polyprenyl-6-hydroxyphenyl methylase/3-demethylubiquinone-9 3-methyltransferase